MSNSKLIQSNPFIPLCIMHYDDPDTNTYRGFIDYPSIIKTESGEEILQCVNYHPGWKKYHTFYALSPMIRPIPSGLKLINATKYNKYPYNTTEIDYAYDPFNTQQDAVSFITWTQPASATVPLYIHISPNGDSYPSFDKNPPSKGNWKKDHTGPLYVLVNIQNTPNIHPNWLNYNIPIWETDSHGHPIFLFSTDHDRCIPDINGISIEKCFLQTDKNILQQTKHNGPSTLISTIESLSQKNTDNNFFKHMPYYVIIIFLVLFILSIIACIIIIKKYIS